MIKMWLASKFRFLSHVGCFLAGLTVVILPWYIFIAVLGIALFFDYLAFSFEYQIEE